MTLPTLEKLAELRKLAEAVKSAGGAHAVHRSIISLNALEDRRRDLRQVVDDATVLSLLDALEAQRVELEELRSMKARVRAIALRRAESEFLLDHDMRQIEKATR